MTYNIQDGAKGRENLHLEVFRTLNPDVIALQEVVDPTVVQTWATELNMKFIVATDISYRKVALLSRYPVLSWASHPVIPGVSRKFLTAILEYSPGKEIVIFCVHLAAHPFVLLELLRTREISPVLKLASQHQSIPCLIAGDFNSVSPSDLPRRQTEPLHFNVIVLLQGNRFMHRVISRVLAAQFSDCFRQLHTDAGYSLPTPEPAIRFDYIFANQALSANLQSCSVVRQPTAVERASDHFPVIAEFNL